MKQYILFHKTLKQQLEDDEKSANHIQDIHLSNIEKSILKLD